MEHRRPPQKLIALAQASERAQRAPKRPLDPAFAALLINQIEPDESPTGRYAPEKRVRAGIVADLRA